MEELLKDLQEVLAKYLKDNPNSVNAAMCTPEELQMALAAILPKIEYFCDEGDEYEGWQSDELKSAIKTLEGISSPLHSYDNTVDVKKTILIDRQKHRIEISEGGKPIMVFGCL